jgi:hypothetical protein
MKRREFPTNSAIFGTMAVFPFSFTNKLFATQDDRRVADHMKNSLYGE